MIDLTDPGVRDFFRDLLEAQYLAKFLRLIDIEEKNPRFRFPPRVQPDPPPFELAPRFSIPMSDLLLGDLLVTALGDPDPAPSRPVLVDQIRRSGLHQEVVKDLGQQLRAGAEALEAEATVFDAAGRL